MRGPTTPYPVALGCYSQTKGGSLGTGLGGVPEAQVSIQDRYEENREERIVGRRRFVRRSCFSPAWTSFSIRRVRRFRGCRETSSRPPNGARLLPAHSASFEASRKWAKEAFRGLSRDEKKQLDRVITDLGVLSILEDLHATSGGGT